MTSNETVHTNAVPKAVGPYAPAVATEALVFTSGQLGVDPATSKLRDTVEEQARQSMRNLGAVLAAYGLDYNAIVKTTIFVTDLANFAKINEVYGSFFPDPSAYPARSCVQVAALPLGGQVEIECVAAR